MPYKVVGVGSNQGSAMNGSLGGSSTGSLWKYKIFWKYKEIERGIKICKITKYTEISGRMQEQLMLYWLLKFEIMQ